MVQKYTVVIRGTPHPWRAPQVVTLPNGMKIAHKDRAELQWKDTVRAEAKTAGVPYVDGPVTIAVLVVYPRPKGWPKKLRLARAPKISRPDGDNLLKCIKDALQAVVVRDDAQFWQESIQRVYGELGEPAHVVIELEYGEPRIAPADERDRAAVQEAFF